MSNVAVISLYFKLQ